MAETYRVYDLYALPLSTVATLAAGLPEDCRVKRKRAGAAAKTGDMLLAAILDGVNLLVWAQTEDAQRGRNRPRSILAAMAGREERDSETIAYNSPEEFEAARARIWGTIHG